MDVAYLPRQSDWQSDERDFQAGSLSEANPAIAYRKGFYYEVKADRRYLWCSCGRSKTQPFCDPSHAGTNFLPIAFTARQDKGGQLLRPQAHDDRPIVRGSNGLG
jgi:CDGSH-type Zn-finger protein